jgi:methionine synthase I (cobalamin-dependent)/5,10-methylenetetrahydrofolate reductase
MKNRFLYALADRALLCDGGMGTVLYSKGVYLNTCFDELNLSNPAIVRAVHREYVQSGADIIETNTFGANRLKLRKYGLNDRVVEINRSGAAIAREEAGEAVFVAGSIGPLGVRIAPLGQLSAAEAEEFFAEQAAALCDGGVDLVILETFSDIHEIEAAIRAVRRVCPGLPLVTEMTIGEDGNSPLGATPEAFTSRFEDLGSDVIGVNCSVGPAPMLQCVERMAKVTRRPLAAMPNAGLPREVEGRNIYLCSPDYMAEFAKRFMQSGVKVIGGCCGTTPAHIKAMKAAVKALQPPRRAVAAPVRPAAASPVLVVPMREKSALGRKLADRVFVKSIEIVPPRGHDPAGAVAAARNLARNGVDCVNIPDGPRASARMSPMALATILAAAAGEAGLEVLLHYTCRDRNLLGMQSDLLGLQANGIRNMLIVTGDPPKLGDYPSATAVFDVDSIGLTSVINGLNRGVDIGGKAMAAPTSFLIGVGVNPGAINLENEIARFERKIEAGAEFAITQPVFDVRALETFIGRTARFRIPIIAGIWPLWSLANAEFMHNEVPGVSIPADVMARMSRAQNKGPEFAREEGVTVSGEIIQRIRAAIHGVQISPPLGKYELALEVLARL